MMKKYKWILIMAMASLLNCFWILPAQSQHRRIWSKLAQMVTNCSDLSIQQSDYPRADLSATYDISQNIAEDFALKNQVYVDQMVDQSIDVKHQWKNDITRFLLRRNDGSGWFPESKINSELLAKYQDMTPSEANTIYAYTRTGPRLNRFLENPEAYSLNDQSFYRGYTLTLEFALDKLPEVDKEMTLYRGIRGAEAEQAKSWQTGDVVGFDLYRSTSTDKSISRPYGRVDEGYAFYEISNPIGHDISDFYELLSAPEVNDSPPGREVLIRPGCRFEVMNIRTEVLSGGEAGSDL